MPSYNRILKQTKKWLESFIIKFNICPFAKTEYDNNCIRYSIIDFQSIDPCLKAVFEECQLLDVQVDIETTLIIFPTQFNSFENYLDFLALAELLLIEQGYQGIYQLASFHPDYCFEGASINDPANYTNRSPYPMLHLIREASLEKALLSYPHPEKIPERNIQLTRKMGLEQIQKLLNKCYSNEE